MSDAAYWKARCEAAESALRRARSRVWISASRREVLGVLADLKAHETLTTTQITERLAVPQSTALAALRKLHGAGLVDRSAERGCRFRPINWKLGHMVVLDELEVLS